VKRFDQDNIRRRQAGERLEKRIELFHSVTSTRAR
jgi:hypothetical protein